MASKEQKLARRAQYMNDNKVKRLEYIENELNKIDDIVKYCCKGDINNVVKWVELIDFISYFIGEDYREVSLDNEYEHLDGDFFLAGNDNDFGDSILNIWKRFKIYLKIIKRFEECELLSTESFPKELELDFWNIAYDDIKILRDTWVKSVNDLIEFFKIYYKLDCFYKRYVYLIKDMSSYLNISEQVYEKIKRKIDSFRFVLIDLAFLKMDGIEKDKKLIDKVKEHIYWIKSLAYMYRIPIAVELMDLIDKDPDELYATEDKKWYGSPNFCDK